MGKTYRLMCEFCGWNRIVSNETEIEDLNEVPFSSIPKGAKYWDKKVDLTPIKQPKKFKCLKCGRLVTPKSIKDSQAVVDEKVKQQKKIDNEKNKIDGCESSTSRPEISRLDAARTKEGSGELPLEPELCVQPALLPEIIEQTIPSISN